MIIGLSAVTLLDDDVPYSRDGSKCTRTQSTRTHEYFFEYSVLVLEYFLQTAICTHTSTRVL